jgi:hypothetical protein
MRGNSHAVDISHPNFKLPGSQAGHNPDGPVIHYPHLRIKDGEYR